MVRSILLRGFDQDIAVKIGEYMSNHGIKFQNDSQPIEFSKSENGKTVVTYKNTKTNEIIKEEYDTVLMAIGRYAVTNNMGLENLGIKLSKSNKVIVDEAEMSSIPNIFSIGDCAEGRPELTPPAIMAGRLLARRLFAGEKALMDYVNIATTVFTPLEYGSVGYSEEDAIKL